MEEIENKDDLGTKVDLLIDFWKHPSIERLHLSGDNSFEKTLEHRMFCWTNMLLSLFFMLVFIMMYFFGLRGCDRMGLVKGGMVLVFTGLGISICGPLLTIRILCKQWRSLRFWEKLDKRDVRDTLSECVDPERDTAHPLAYWLWQRVILLDIFGYRFIWWWALIIGVLGVFVKNWDTNFSKVFEGNTGSELMVVFLTSVLAFIATNVIRELIVVRNSYLTSSNELKETNREIAQFRKEIVSNTEVTHNAIEQLDSKINESIKEIPGLFGTLKATTEILNTQINMIKLVDMLSKHSDQAKGKFNPSLLLEASTFAGNCTRRIENFIAQIDRVDHSEYLGRCLLSTLNRYMTMEGKLLNHKQRRIVALHSTLAAIAENIVGNFFPSNGDVKSNPVEKKDIEFFALLAIPPQDFLNKGGEGTAGDEDWEKYLNSNIRYASKGIKQRRFFLCLSDLHEERSINELNISILSDMLKNKYVKVGPDGIPMRGEKGYCIVGEKNRKDGCEWENLAKLLYERYHSECCYLREVNSQIYDEFFRDSQKGNSPLDFFAVKHVHMGWLFCLQAAYNEKLKVADIKIHYDSQVDSEKEEWDGVVERLDLVFGDESQNTAIGKIIHLKDYY